jgi:hypothetical protein
MFVDAEIVGSGRWFVGFFCYGIRLDTVCQAPKSRARSRSRVCQCHLPDKG